MRKMDYLPGTIAGRWELKRVRIAEEALLHTVRSYVGLCHRTMLVLFGKSSAGFVHQQGMPPQCRNAVSPLAFSEL